jgi:hypothetical protein
VNVPEVYVGYCGATGNHARAILDAIRGAAYASIDRTSDRIEAALDRGTATVEAQAAELRRMRRPSD